VIAMSLKLSVFMASFSSPVRRNLEERRTPANVLEVAKNKSHETHTESSGRSIRPRLFQRGKIGN
jgi:hypothetical protein